MWANLELRIRKTVGMVIRYRIGEGEGDCLAVDCHKFLINAVKFTERGHIIMSAKVQEKNGGLYLQVKISDTGIGIRKQDMDQLFISFNQLNANKNRGKEGTGLSLAISRSLSQMMGGDIEVEGDYGKGSAFTVTVQQQGVEGVGALSILE